MGKDKITESEFIKRLSNEPPSPFRKENGLFF
jgi:hypothetical protein